jgi:esterase/lipase superfamily enzyme
MERQMFTWFSPNLQREMSVARWGDYGKPVLLFATAVADCLDYERFLVIKKLMPLIEAKRIKVYSCGAISGDGWLSKTASNRHKTWLQARFDDYLVRELCPLLKNDSGGNTGFIAAGASLGAYNALNAVCKHPDWFDGCVGMSGTYEFDRWVPGYRDMDYYYNQPLLYVGNLPEGPQLDTLRRAKIILASGQGRAEAAWETEKMGAILRGKGVQAHVEIWGHDVHHDWPTWRTMLPMFLDRIV